MSTFSCPLVKVEEVVPHPNADRLDVVKVLGYHCIVGRGQFKSGDYGIYIPEGAVVPDNVADAMGLKGKLAGGTKNRVKAVKLRGILSQGLLMDMKTARALTNEAEIDDCAALLGITKYEPPVPVQFGGGRWGPGGIPEHCTRVGTSYTINYDIENLRRYPNVFQANEPVVFTEKLHGTFCGIGWRRDLQHEDLFHGSGLVFSKGLGAKGIVFKPSATNVYVNMARQGLLDTVRLMVEKNPGCRAIFLLGEIFGNGVQDLTYGHERGKMSFRAFDLYVLDNAAGIYVNHEQFKILCEHYNVPTVPELYSGGWEPEVAAHFARGATTLGGGHMREGIVVRPQLERHDPALGRVILKVVSDEYLLREKGTEFS